MKTISTTEARNNFRMVVDEVKRSRHSIAVERHGQVEVYISPAAQWNPKLSDETNMAALSGSFDFLEDEPDLYTDADLKKRYDHKS